MITVRPSDFKNASNKMDDAANKIDVAIAHIDSIMDSLDSVWHDAYSRKYLNQYKELQKLFPEFKSSLYGYSTFLNSLLEIYKKEFTDPTSEEVR